ncbi:hypothetical protein SEA_PCORAL7_39 [Gordonia phage PCoral7]|uniref:Uncharacterized protein n=1 Tax=Gordonia phage Toast TaxID=2599852 RepID=A0A5J6TB76_9CAUD|nr:hypothetical protein JZX81_gp39 [Gordonia phage Toast]QFG08141.1 hypothetical protein PBI_TOAST_39 [Gordonia phage Toast]UVF60547.1 hypothetical protein SEA_PCORAL7_39 [Gordonia phage PCoral7]
MISRRRSVGRTAARRRAVDGPPSDRALRVRVRVACGACTLRSRARNGTDGGWA